MRGVPVTSIVIWAASGLAALLLAQAAWTAAAGATARERARVLWSARGELLGKCLAAVGTFSALNFVVAVREHEGPDGWFFAASLGVLLVNFCVSFLVTCLIVRAFRGLLRREHAVANAKVYSAVLVLSCTNLELLSQLPWRTRVPGGFPNKRVLSATFITTALRDAPQLWIQARFLQLQRHEAGEQVAIASYICLGISAYTLVSQLFVRYMVLALGAKKELVACQDAEAPLAEPLLGEDGVGRGSRGAD